MKGAWHRDIVVTIKLRRSVYERIQPQGGGNVRALQPVSCQCGRDPGERDGQPRVLPQRRGGSGSALAFVESSKDGCGETGPVRGIPRIRTQEILKAKRWQK